MTFKRKRLVNRESLSEKILVNNSFYLSDKEHEQARDFESQHNECGKGFSYSFSTGSGIGIGVDIECRGCQATQDITDLRYW